MAGGAAGSDSEELRQIADKLARWRREHGGRGRRIPEVLWLAAAGVARKLGVREVARVLSVSAAQLARRIEATEGFVEVSLPSRPGAPSRTGSVLVAVEGPLGEQLRLELPLSSARLAPAVVAAFLAELEP